MNDLNIQRLQYIRKLSIQDTLSLLEEIDYITFKEIVELINVDDFYHKLKANVDFKKITSKKFPKLRNINIILKLVPEQLLLKLRCQYDIEFFAENFFYIVHSDYGLIKIPLRNGQKLALQLFAGEDVTYDLPYYDPDDIENEERELIKVNFKDNRFSLIKTNRQYGKCVSLNSYITIKKNNSNYINNITIGHFYIKCLIKEIIYNLKRKIKNVTMRIM